MELNEIKTLALSLMKEHGLTQRGWILQFDNAVRRHGQCRHRSRIISLSSRTNVLREESSVKNTILHEIAHALVGGGHGHDYVWKAQAKEIGCTGERCSSDGVKIQGKYIGHCPNGHVYYKHRKPKGERSCSKCHPKFDTRFLISFKENETNS